MAMGIGQDSSFFCTVLFIFEFLMLQDATFELLCFALRRLWASWMSDTDDALLCYSEYDICRSPLVRALAPRISSQLFRSSHVAHMEQEI